MGEDEFRVAWAPPCRLRAGLSFGLGPGPAVEWGAGCGSRSGPLAPAPDLSVRLGQGVLQNGLGRAPPPVPSAPSLLPNPGGPWEEPAQREGPHSRVQKPAPWSAQGRLAVPGLAARGRGRLKIAARGRGWGRKRGPCAERGLTGVAGAGVPGDEAAERGSPWATQPWSGGL